MDLKIDKELMARVAGAVKSFARSKYGLFALISFMTLSMSGYIIVQSMVKKTPTPPPVIYSRTNVMVATIAPTITVTPTTDLSPTLSRPVLTGAPVPTLTSIPTPSPTIDPTSNWLTYTNSSYKYAVKYPEDWVIQDISPLEPLVPSYIVFNQQTASASSRNITISVSKRSYAEQLAIGGAGSPIIIAGISGTQEYLKDSNGNESVTIVLPLSDTLILLHSKLIYTTIFNQMLQTFKFVN